MKILKEIFETLKQTFTEFTADSAPREAAALAYYTAFAIAPLLIVIISIVGAIWGPEAVRGQIVADIQGTVGQDGAAVIEDIIQNAYREESNIISTIFSGFMLLMGASAVFAQLQTSLNNIWNVEPTAGGGIVGFVRDKLLTMSMLFVIGFLLLVSLVISALIASLNDIVSGLLPGMQLLVSLINFGVSFGITTVLFALIYKFLPDAEIHWRDALVGGAVTSLLFSIGRFALGIYLGNSSTSSVYGAAGSFVVIILWIYYAAQIMLFGAEFTQVFARRYGHKIISDADGVDNVEVPGKLKPLDGEKVKVPV